MADVFSKEKRSEVMSRIRGKGNRTTELRMITLFRAHGIKGWRRHLPLPGKPDFTFRNDKLVVFVDGCFWHGCPHCFRAPANNADFWERKIHTNKKRDRKNDRELRRLGWAVIRVWECSLKKSPNSAAKRVMRILDKRANAPHRRTT